ncbi:major facilitator superfamily domain-containing protein 1 isoform X2 [Hydra vulgaris]|uniref:Lysosomal dipeptide transporter MFSD1 n=1 Tax=Hydra vulgaris TaxID=6087 RepID=A0ABM4BJR4_HYDVU
MDSEKSCFHASKGYYRFLVLFFNCMLTFGSYFCFDMPSVLQDSFTGTYGRNCTINTNNITVCKEHLGLSDTEYNLLYTVYAWMNAIVVIGAGVLIDKFGQRVGALFFSTLCVIGSMTFAAGYFFKGKKAMFVLFLLGRLIFGAGNGSLTIAQSKISAFWFEGKELAFAFGCTLSFSRLGSVFNFLFTESFAVNQGLKWTLWGGSFLCVFGWFSAIIIFILDRNGQRQLIQERPTKVTARKMRLGDIRNLNIQFWFLAVTTMFFYNTVFPFIADASKFIHEKYGYIDQRSAVMAGSVYDISLILTPLLGITVDYIGYRGIMASACAVFTIPVFSILAFTDWHPLIGTLLLGATYSAAATSMWPSVPLVVNPIFLGTAMGLMTSMQMIGIGSCNLVVGSILDSYKKNPHKWKFVMLFLFANALACVLLSVVLNIIDFRQNGVLNKTSKRKQTKKAYLSNDKESLIVNKPHNGALDVDAKSKKGWSA